MCGVTVWISEDRAVPRDEFEAMTDRLRRRGPDGRGAAYFRSDRVALGHRRLAILDLTDAGAQPMSLPARGLTLTFNGEIYNHPELRRELESAGAVYRSTCDAETILHGYAKWGPDVVKKLRGIFAFAIWDDQRGELFAARDHLGVKPLYRAEIGGGLAFASQPHAFFALRAFEKEVCPEGFRDALQYGVATGERSAFRGVSKLPPAHCFSWRGGESRMWRYWSLPEEATIARETEAIEAVAALLADSVSDQMLSDVPVHSLLSGGIDSSAIASVALRKRARFGQAFTLGFEDPTFDESRYAALAAEAIDCPHTIERLTRTEATQILDAAVEAFDEPYGIDSALPMVAISQFMAKAGVKVTLSGDGADECFAGYRHYDALARHYARFGRRDGDGRGATFTGRARSILSGGFSPFPAYTSHNGWFRQGDLINLAGPKIIEFGDDVFHRERSVFNCDRPPVDAAQRADIQSYLPDEILVKIDRTTMAYGIEARVPFLDHRLVELAFSIEPTLHYQGGERKALLKAAARRWLPPSVLTRRKKGFSAPVGEFFLASDAQRKAAFDTILTGPLVTEGWVNGLSLRKICKRSEYAAGAAFQLMLIDRWYRCWVNADGFS